MAGTTSENELEQVEQGAESWLEWKHQDESRSGMWVHAAHGCVRGGERSWIWAAVSLSITLMGPPQTGQVQKARVSASLGMGWVLGCDFGTEFSNCEHSGSNAVRWQLARKPKLRMRTKPRGSTWRRNRRKNSSTGIVIKRFLFW